MTQTLKENKIVEKVEDFKNQANVDLIYDTRVSNSLFSQLMIAEYCSVFFSTLGLLVNIIVYELRIRGQSGALMDVANTYNLMCTIFLLFSVFIRYDLWLSWSKSVNRFTSFDTLSNTGLWKYMIFEMVICAVAPYPFLNGVYYVEVVEAFSTEITYEINDILLFFMFCRLYLLVRFSFYLTEFMNPRTQRVCQMHGCESDSMFALKGLMKQKPYPILLSGLAITIIIFGYQLRIFEAPLSEASEQDFTSMNNAMWNTIITLTSAGYGELYPKTFFGRIVGVIICFWGVLIISFFVVTVTNMLNFTPNEEKAYNLLMRLYYKTEMKKKAIGVLQSAFVYRNTKENEPNNLKLILSNFRTFRSHMIMFKKIARLVRSLD